MSQSAQPNRQASISSPNRKSRKIVLEGNKELIKKIDESGYEWLRTEHGIEIEKEEQKMNQISIGTCATKEALKK